MSDLRLAIVQTTIEWENPQKNCEHYAQLLDGIETDLVVLPEMFATGFTMHPKGVAESLEESYSLRWMKEQASILDCAVIGSLAIEENGHYYNRCFFVKPDGSHVHYNKRHLFSMAGEHKAYTAGTERLIVDYKGWHISPFVCYDLRFPVWSKLNGEADLMVYCANWPTPRVNAWSYLLLARAIENQCYVVGCNRIGEDNNGFEFNGKSAIIDPYGNYLAQDMSNETQVLQAVCQLPTLEAFREKFPVHKDADSFKII